MYNPLIKRLTDIILSFFGIIILSPLIIGIIIILLIVNNGKPFFLQPRPGFKGNIFKIIKFKTMLDLKPEDKGNEHSVSRITKAGVFIRKYSLDEILQLINVFKGDMSLIGPRPLLVEYLPLYNQEQQKRHDVKPGITGWAQIKGRNSIEWKEKFKYDVWYVDNINFLLDVKIFFLTIKKVIVKEGINLEQNTTMPVWKGNE